MTHIITHRFTKHETPYPLGRHIEHDSRSRLFSVQVPPTGVVKKSVSWPHLAPDLNQERTSGCTGFGMTNMLNCTLFAPSRKAVKGSEAWLTSEDALGLYSLATHLDGFGPDNYYPPNDQGSTGTGVAKAALQDGYITTYLHAYTLSQVQAALQAGPVIAGVSWTQAMFRCDAVTGFVTVGALNDSTIAGGHEFAVLGVDYGLQCFECVNNWGDGWGGGDGLAKGRFRIRFGDFERLLADEGDVIAPRGKNVVA